jgi:hypothetical protein
VLWSAACCSLAPLKVAAARPWSRRQWCASRPGFGARLGGGRRVIARSTTCRRGWRSASMRGTCSRRPAASWPVGR